MKRKRQSLHWLLIKSNPLVWVGSHIRHLLCKVLGHKKPYEQRFSAQTCPRCCLVMKEEPKYLKLPLK